MELELDSNSSFLWVRQISLCGRRKVCESKCCGIFSPNIGELSAGGWGTTTCFLRSEVNLQVCLSKTITDNCLTYNKNGNKCS
jgi:hypothetical protein